MQLIEGLRIETGLAVPVKEGSEVWRIIVRYISDIPEKDKLLKKYYVWVTGEYLEDKVKLNADINSAKNFAIDLAKKRFKKSGNQIPVENGISCSNKDGIIYVNPKEYVHPEEKS